MADGIVRRFLGKGNEELPACPENRSPGGGSGGYSGDMCERCKNLYFTSGQ